MLYLSFTTSETSRRSKTDYTEWPISRLELPPLASSMLGCSPVINFMSTISFRLLIAVWCVFIFHKLLSLCCFGLTFGNQRWLCPFLLEQHNLLLMAWHLDCNYLSQKRWFIYGSSTVIYFYLNLQGFNITMLLLL